MTKPKTYRTKTGRVLTDDDITALVDEVETTTYDIDALKPRRRGRPAMGSAPAEVVPVRLDPALRDAVEARAHEEQTTTSEVIRRALRSFLDVA
jgi:Ribbon-helix-helix protein, copG family